MKLNVEIFADGADLQGMLEMNNQPFISGFTTNPTLMNKAGIKNYKEFALSILSEINDKPISFEVFSDDFEEMERQANEISTWGENVFVKIPITNTKGESSKSLVEKLSNNGVKLNVTAMFTIKQVEQILPFLENSEGSNISIFAGRIADTGVDPLPIMKEAVKLLQPYSNIKLIWASPRELYNVVQASEIGCHIITVTNSILKKLSSLGKNLNQFSLETVQMFYDDAKSAGYTIDYEKNSVGK